jgi:hypothetical protein
MNTESQAELPDPFRFDNGDRVATEAGWRRRRQKLLELVLGIEYGQLPPSPARTSAELLIRHNVGRFESARHEQYRVSTGPGKPFWFFLDLLVPPGDGPFPIILTGDACWHSVSDDIASEVLRRGYALAEFNRVQIVPDVRQPDRISELYEVYPEGNFGALAAWAWGYHRCIDVLGDLPYVDSSHIAVTGHSRGGKAALLAGATDERIALTTPNDSGCGGAGCFRRQGEGSETLADIVRTFPDWFGPNLRDYIGREDALPFDQHSLKALVAPRALLSTEALGDKWANPSGTWQTFLAAREVYRFLGAEDRIAIWYREGGHDQGLADWSTLLEFADWQFYGKSPSQRFQGNQFPELAMAFSWRAPENRRETHG